MPRLLIVFAKWPQPGRVKTRLARELGEQRAAEIYRELVGRVLVRLAGLGAGESLWIAFDPPGCETPMREWLGTELQRAGIEPAAVAFRAQAAGDLGARLRAAFEEGFAAGFERIAAIGTDCIELELGTVCEAWAALDGGRVVFGPASDGGYYLVAVDRREALACFDNVPWSSERTLEVSAQRAREAGFEVTLLGEMSDVDTVEDWLTTNGHE